MINIDDPGMVVALLAIIAGVRLALYVAERLSAAKPAASETPVLSPDDTAEETPLVLATPGSNQRESAPASPLRFFAEVLDSAFIAVALVFLLIRPFVLQAFYIPSESMVPTLLMGDKLLVTKYSFHLREPHHGEIVVFHAPKIAVQMSGRSYDPKTPVDYVKRVIGLPGDRIRIVYNQGVYVNGKLMVEPYVADKPNYNYPLESDGETYTFPSPVREKLIRDVRGQELVVPRGYYFVLGDNRTMSHDSHIWGLVPHKALVGKAAIIFWPPGRIRAL